MASLNYDRRRINGPDRAAPPVFAPLPPATESASAQRADRAPSDIRKIFLRTGLITQASGSSYIEAERTKIAVAVYGPRQLKNSPFADQGQLDVQVKYAPFAVPRRIQPMRAESPSLSTLLYNSLLPSLRLSLYPKSTIDVHLTVLESDAPEAGIAAVGVIACSAALAEAGVEMLGLVMGCSVAKIGKEIWLDPTRTEAEADRAKGTLGIAVLPALGNDVTNIWQRGELSLEEVDEMIQPCIARCADIHHVVVQVLLDSAKKKLSAASQQ